MWNGPWFVPVACEIHSVYLIEDGEPHIWMVFCVIDPGGLPPLEDTKQSLFSKPLRTEEIGSFDHVVLALELRTEESGCRLCIHAKESC